MHFGIQVTQPLIPAPRVGSGNTYGSHAPPGRALNPGCYYAAREATSDDLQCQHACLQKVERTMRACQECLHHEARCVGNGSVPCTPVCMAGYHLCTTWYAACAPYARRVLEHACCGFILTCGENASWQRAEPWRPPCGRLLAPRPALPSPAHQRYACVQEHSIVMRSC